MAAVKPARGFHAPLRRFGRAEARASSRRSAWVRIASRRSASQEVRPAEVRPAEVRMGEDRLAEVREAERGFSSRHAFQVAAPCLSNATCSTMERPRSVRPGAVVECQVNTTSTAARATTRPARRRTSRPWIHAAVARSCRRISFSSVMLSGVAPPGHRRFLGRFLEATRAMRPHRTMNFFRMESTEHR